MKFSTLLIFLFVAIPFSILAQELETNTYSIDPNPISNPERGFYHHTEVHTSTYSFLNFNTLKNYREEENITQILRVFYLEDFVSLAISKEYIDNMHADFNTVRAAGLKVIIRFAYTKKSSKPYGDATPEFVKNHIFQLKEVLQAHQDVISVIQSGFIGAWGEWYYTDHFAGDFAWIVSDENWQDRATVVNDLLRVLPKNRMVQLRTPKQKMIVFDTEEPIDQSMAYSAENISRAGHHNDCFVASETDLGTYQNIDLEKSYLEEETKFLPMGGETCGLSPPYSDCANAYSELQRFHWSYLNIDYNTTVLNVWKDQDCYNDVELNLGYRYVLEDATLETEVHPEGKFDLSINLRNYGFANPYNARDFEVILQSISTNQVYRLTTDETMGLWPIQEDFNLAIQAGFPNGVIEGTYKVYLNFPDKSPSIKENPAYSIRLANGNIWEESEGWNDLGFELTINSGFPVTSYQGDEFFDALPFSEIDVLGPRSIYHGVNQEVALLFWGRSLNHEYRRIDRSVDGVNFEMLSYISATNDSYKIVDNENDYYYRYALIGENGELTYSNTILVNASASATSKITIDTDGDDEDWKDVLPTASFVSASYDSYILRTHFALEKVHFILYGAIDNHKVYLNTDQKSETGSNESSLLAGMDYKIEDGALFKFENNQWSSVSSDISTTNNGSILEIELSHSFFQNLNSNYLIPIVAYFNDDNILLSEDAMNPSIHIRVVPPDAPANFDVRNSIPFPEERIEIHWEKCAFCVGYILEKSNNGTDFFFLEDIEAEDEVFYHDFLPNGTHYYRIRGYNILGESPNSSIESATLGLTSIDQIEKLKDFKVWPNPTNEIIQTDLDFESVSIYNVLGEFLENITNQNRVINVSNLPPGVYFFAFKINKREKIKKVIKY